MLIDPETLIADFAAAADLVGIDRWPCELRAETVRAPHSIAWLVRGPNRRLRYRGTARNRLWLGHRLAAVNLQRLVNLGRTHRADRWAIA